MVSITDSTNKTVSFSVPPQRVVCLIPSITETLFDLGLGDAVAGVSKFCIFPADGVRNKIKVGGQKDPDLEKIKDINPDLIIMNLEENKPEHIEFLSTHYKTWVTYPRSFRDAGTLIREIGRVFHAAKEAGAYADKIKKTADDLNSKTGQAVKTLYLIWRNPWMSINKDTFIHDTLTIHGLENVFGGKEQRYFEVTEEELRSAAPDVIVLPDEPYRFREKHIAEFLHIPVPAVRNRQIFLADGTYFCWYGTRTARASEYIHEQILSPIESRS
jgi:ABC-type Fe3+-hydroxamate transport system substrate-binding protein